MSRTSKPMRGIGYNEQLLEEIADANKDATITEVNEISASSIVSYYGYLAAGMAILGNVDTNNWKIKRVTVSIIGIVTTITTEWANGDSSNYSVVWSSRAGLIYNIS